MELASKLLAFALPLAADERVTALLVDVYANHEHEFFREDAVRGLIAQIEVLATTNTLKALTLALKDHNVNIRRHAASKMYRLIHPRTVEPLIEALDDPDEAVRSHAVESLGRLGDARAIEPLIACFEKWDEWELSGGRADTLVNALVELCRKDRTPLTAALQEKPNPNPYLFRVLKMLPRPGPEEQLSSEVEELFRKAREG
jgi:HEAT repeats